MQKDLFSGFFSPSLREHKCQTDIAHPDPTKTSQGVDERSQETELEQRKPFIHLIQELATRKDS